MKKTLLAVAVAAALPAVAFAQSNVTMFGIVDATFAYGKSEAGSKTQLSNSGYNSSRFGVRGSESLGGGLTASFHLEASVNNDNGTGAPTSTSNQALGTTSITTVDQQRIGNGQGLTWNRRSTVSLAGGFGELRFGRDYTPQFWNHTVYDPFGTNGVGTTRALSGAGLGGANTVNVRASNTFGYFTPKMGGFQIWAQGYLGENAAVSPALATEDDGNGFAVRASYSAGPFSIAGTTAKTTFATGDVKSNNIGASYMFGKAKLMGYYTRDSAGAGADQNGWLIGGTMPVGPGTVRLAYSTTETDVAGGASTDQIAVGYVYDLSKRTALYATFARVSNDNGASSTLNGAPGGAVNVNRASTGYDLGIRHTF